MEIINYPNYLIYDDGRVQNKKTKRFLKQNLHKTGYYRVILYKNGKGKTFLIHRLVGLHYIPLVEGKNEVDHIDRDKSNNNVSNLRWCNRSENNINIDIKKNKKLNHKHIYKTKFNTYEFHLHRNNKHFTKNFKTLDECIKYRDDYISTHYPQLPLY